MSQEPILVTGTSSGIGREITELLSSKGHTVYATVRKETDCSALENLPHVIPFELDVTRASSVEAVAKRIGEEGRGLYGLVNSAGVASFGPLVVSPIEDLQRVLEVNLLGPYRMTTACFPYLAASHGRVVNISSVEGFLTETFDGAYVISKHALEAYTDVLRDEVAQLDIRVSAIEPGGFRTKLIANLAALKGPGFLQSFRGTPYGETIEEGAQRELASEGGLELANRPHPRPVAEAVYDALFSATPRDRYLVAKPEDRKAVLKRVRQWMDQLDAKPEFAPPTT